MLTRQLSRAAPLAFAFGLAVFCAQAAPATPQGVITAKGFLNIGGGTTVADLTGNAKFPDSPDVVQYPTYFEWNATGDINTAPGNYADNYGVQIVGYFYPPATGDYIFYIAADDGANLYLSTDATPENKKLIAQEAGWSNARSYFVIGGTSTVEAKDSSQFAATEWPTKDPVLGGALITLQQGQIYYIEALMKEGGGGDNLSVSCLDPDGVMDYLLPIPGQYLSSFDKTTGPLTIITQPQSQTVDEGQSVTFSVEVDGTPPYTYQWKKGGVDIAGATGPSYTINRVYRVDNNASFTVAITGAQGSQTSAAATLTVINDTTPPTITWVTPPASFDFLTVTFSEPLDEATAEVASNYQLSGGLTVNSATLSGTPGSAGDNIVILGTSLQTEGTTLTLTVNNVKDVPGNTIAAPNNTLEFGTAQFVLGWASYDRWHNENGDPGAIAAFAAAIADGSIRPPDYSTAVRQLGAPWGVRDNYAARVSGYLVPATSGNYAFFIGSDDQSNLYLSTDANPANKKLIAQEINWSNQYQFVSSGGGSDLTAKRSDQFTGTEWPGQYTISLTANNRYYIEILMDEGGGGDGADATMVTAGSVPTDDAAGMTLRGNIIGTYMDPNGAEVNITQQPVDTSQQEERPATFTVATTVVSPYVTTATYQWQKTDPGGSTFTDIAGAMAASYTTPVLTLADNNTKYRVVCSVPTLSVNSAEVTLTVVPDTFPPVLVGAGSIMKGTGIEIGIGFDENVDRTTASAAANYTLSKGTVTSVRYQQFDHTDGAPFFVLGSSGPFNGAAVVLTTSGLASGDTVNVTVKNVQDLKGNAMSATGETRSLFVTSKMKWAAMGGTDYLEGRIPTDQPGIVPNADLWPDDVVAYSEADFDLISSGTANWNNYDEATFVYEEVEGDFDKIVRIEYQDPTSQWARAGLCATPNADEGVTRAEVEGGYLLEKRFMQRVNPAIQWNGAAGNNQHEWDYRDTAGGNYGGGGAGTPAYPNAWLRMQRAGQIFTAYYSADGEDWTQYGTWTFGATVAEQAMPQKLLVGPYYSPEYNNNVAGQGVGHSSVAKFRQYGSYVAVPSKVDYGIGLNFGADEYYTGDPAVASNAGTLPTISTAGAPNVVQANWNNLTLLDGTKGDLVADIRGAAQPTAATVTWSSANTWSSTGRGEENNALPGNDKILMTGYLDTGNATTTTVDISGIPSELTAAENGYDVYVYALGGVEGRGGAYRILDAQGGLLKDYVRAQSPQDPTEHIQVVPVAGAWSPGTYIVFSGLTANAIKVEASTVGGLAYGGTPRAPINAIQLVLSAGAAQPPGVMTINWDGENVTIGWEGDGILQSAPDVTGPWTDVGPDKPASIPATDAKGFFRVQGM